MARFVSLYGSLYEAFNACLLEEASSSTPAVSSLKKRQVKELLSSTYSDTQIRFLNAFLDESASLEDTTSQPSPLSSYMEMQCQKIYGASASLFMKFMASFATRRATFLEEKKNEIVKEECEEGMSVYPIRVRQEETKNLYIKKRENSSLSLYPIYVEKGGTLLLSMDAIDLALFGG